MESAVTLPLSGTAARSSPGRWGGRWAGRSSAPATKRTALSDSCGLPDTHLLCVSASTRSAEASSAPSTAWWQPPNSLQVVQRSQSLPQRDKQAPGAPSKLVITTTPGADRPAALAIAASSVSKNAASSFFCAVFVKASCSAPWAGGRAG